MNSNHSASGRYGLPRIIGILSVIALLLGLAPTTALACACGCSVFDVGGGLLPQEDDHGGRIFTEWWHADQNQNWIGSSKGPASANSDKQVLTNWYTVGFQYMFNREWGVAVRVPYVDRSFTTQDPDTLMLNNFRATDFGDVEIVGMYTGFSKDMSTGIMFGLKLPSGNYTAPGFDRDTQIGSGSTDLILGAFHRGMITGDNAWQYFAQIRAQVPFLYRSAVNPDTGVSEIYKPGYQIDGAAGIVYNNGYNILGFDKIAPVLQVIGSHRVRDSGDAADPLNSGFDRLMIGPGIEFTKVIDEANKRVMKLYVDVELPFYYRVNAGVNGDGSQGQLIAPVLTKVIASYNF
jgi:hypothetical protein